MRKKIRNGVVIIKDGICMIYSDYNLNEVVVQSR